MTAASVPVSLRVHLTHATLQALAAEARVDLLHIKGPAVDAALRPTRPASDPHASPGEVEAVPRMSTDADVLVRPAHLKRFLRTLRDHRWRVITTFESGSAFGHAASWWHDDLGYVDVHRHFPGFALPPGETFDHLWAGHGVTSIAHWPCTVPAVEAQRLILLLHGARGGGLANSDVALLWTDASLAVQEDIRGLARRLHAEVALAGAIGELASYVDDPSHDLWQVFQRGSPEDRLAEWRARLKAAPTLTGKARVAARSLLVNTDHLAMEMGRQPTAREVAHEYMVRARKLRAALGRRAARNRSG